MPTTKEPRRSARVSDLVRQFEEKIKPPDKNIKLIRDVFRSKTSVDRLKQHKLSYMNKCQKVQSTTWYVKELVNDSSDMSSDYKNNSYMASSTCTSTKDSKETEIVDDLNCNIATKVVLRSQYEPNENNMFTNSDDEEQEQELMKNLSDNVTKINIIDKSIKISANLNTRISTSDKKILRKDCYISNKIIIVNPESENSTSKYTAKTDSDNDVSLESRNKYVDCVNSVAPDNKIEKTSHVVSWIKESQFANEIGNMTQDYNMPSAPSTPPEIKFEQLFEKSDIYRESNIQNKSVHNYIDAKGNREKEVVTSDIDDLYFGHSYENVQIYRRNLQKEMILIDNIERLNDFDDTNEDTNDDTDVTKDYTEEDGQDISEGQYINIGNEELDINIQCDSSGSNEIILHTAKSLESIPAFNVDEVDISSSEMFGEGNFTFKIRTSYWEVINPMHNKNAPEEFFNEINHLTSISIDIAKYINKKKDEYDESVDEIVEEVAENSDAKGSVTQYYSHESLCDTNRQRCESFQSGETLGSDDFLVQLFDNHSSTEDMQCSPNLIRTQSKLVRVDQTYYNNTLRITNNVVINEMTKKKSEYIVDELLETEFTYLSKLELVRDQYIPALNDSIKYPNLIGKTKYIFLNWNMICLRVCDFYERIEACGYKYEKLADIILKSRELFEEHSLYCKNKEIADRILQGEVALNVEEIQNGDKLDLSTYLLEPVQRLTRYILLLKKLKKELSKTRDCQKLSDAINMIQQLAYESNNVIAASHIKNIPFELKDQGRIIRKDNFTVIKMRNKTKWADMRIFLYEKVLIIASHVKSSGEYIYKDHIFMDHMSFQSDDKKFIASDYTRNKQANDIKYQSFVCKSKDAEVIREWNNLITEQLMLQVHKMKDDANLNINRRRKR